ncbi:MAG: phosphoglucosamine mutase [Thermoplasmata archaeon]|nr:MAG: phosphoglucosamine mutase [Thermoplasmata archaeon]
MKLFGSSGIRGLVNTDISVELAVNVGEVIGTLHKRVVLGHDPRTSSQLFLHAITSGLLSTGCEAFFAGMVTTPTLAYAARNFDCGIMITASHNPPEYNGIKFFNPDGSGFGATQMEEVEGMINENRSSRAQARDISYPRTYHNAIEEHMRSIKDSIGSLDLKVVVDCGCGAASTITPLLFRRLGCEVLTLNCQPDGFFPGRASEPKRENLGALMEAVVANKAHLGIAHDGDADRMVAVDEKGKFVDGDSLLALYAKHEVHTSIVVPVSASIAIDNIVGNAKVIRTKVGDVFISEMLREKKGDFGGEPSGTWIFPRHCLCPDGVFAAARLAELVQKEPLSDQIDILPRYPRKKGTIACPNEMKERIPALVKENLASLDYEDLSNVDGVRIQFPDAWALIRASGTEPKIRLTVEAENENMAETLYDKVYEVVKGCVKP